MVYLFKFLILFSPFGLNWADSKVSVDEGENINSSPYPDRPDQTSKIALKTCTIPLRWPINAYASKIFTDLPKQLQAPWPFLVRIDSVDSVDSFDGGNNIIIKKKISGELLRELYEYDKSFRSLLSVAVSIIHSKSHSYFYLHFSLLFLH
jgi:hypothetical protein